MGTENPLHLMDGDYEFYCLQVKSPVRIESSVRFQVIFLDGDDFWSIFLERGGFHLVCDAGYFYGLFVPTKRALIREYQNTLSDLLLKKKYFIKRERSLT